MPRYYFDIQDGEEIFPDREGAVLADDRQASVMAAHSLQDVMRFTAAASDLVRLSVTVREGKLPVLRATLTLSIERLR